MLLQLILLPLEWVVAGFLGIVAPAALERGRDRRMLTEGRARCGIRAVEGRVHDIGTEWSRGVCTITPGRIRFTPSVGIVGDRDVRVVRIENARERTVDTLTLDLDDMVVFRITTDRGDLYWALPPVIAEPAGDLLVGLADTA